MSTLELKEILKSKTDQIDDGTILSAVNTILESKSNNDEIRNLDSQIINLTETQKMEIQNFEREYLKGNCIENEV